MNNKEQLSAIIAIAAGIFVPMILISSFHLHSFILVPLMICGFASVIAGIIMLIRSSIMIRKQQHNQSVKYVGCLSTHTFHRPSCRSVQMLTRENRVDYGPEISSQFLQSIGMHPCSKCKPR